MSDDLREQATLRPCPFCGGDAAFKRLGNPRQSCIVSCNNCGCGLEVNENWHFGMALSTRAAIEPAPQEPEKYTIGDLTMDRVFRAAGLTNVSDMQAVFDQVEIALRDTTKPAPVGLFNALTDEQKTAALSFDEDESFGPDEFRRNHGAQRCAERDALRAALEAVADTTDGQPGALVQECRQIARTALRAIAEGKE